MLPTSQAHFEVEPQEQSPWRFMTDGGPKAKPGLSAKMGRKDQRVTRV